MKRPQILLSILALVFTVAAQADDIVPKKLNFDRYTAMLNRSPFAVATAVAPASTTPSWSKDLYVANAAHTADADYVTIISGADKSVKEYLSTKGPNEDGYAIANIQWSDKPGETKVTISKDGQFATLPFNQALLAAPGSSGQPPPATVVPPPPGIPTPPTAPNMMPKPPMTMPVPNAAMPTPAVPAPAVPAQTPRVRGVIQRNPSGPGPAPVATPYVRPTDDE